MPRSFWTLPANSPDWMRPPDWMALGNPGKIVGTMWDEKLKQWVVVEAAAGIGNPGKIVGYDPQTGIFYQAAAGTEGPSAWPLVGLLSVAGICIWLWNR